ncbi:MAG: hypothetical protein DME12_13430 [Candidatus Rokuibacteriota bacterium]|nr:MAG: hypothetical protein DME12_13430 [Candidatus Rokubacteria bacterium]
MSTMRSMIALTLVVSVMLLVDPGCHHVVAAPRADLREPPLAKSVARDREVYTEKILAVLEPRLVDAAARARAAEKLATLSDARLRLMAALSDRVALVGAAPADGIALFLLTALLILS